MARTVAINIVGNPEQAIAALEAVGIKAEETAAKTDSIGKSSSHASQKISEFGKAAGIAIVAVVAGAVDMANRLEDSQARMRQAIENTGGSFKRFTPMIDATQKAYERLGFTNAQVDDAIAAGTTATGSVTKALGLMGLAADLARFKHISLSQAMTTVARASEGQTRMLKQLGIDLPVVAGGAAKVHAAQLALSKAQEHYAQLLEVDHYKKHLTIADHIALHNAQQNVVNAQQKLNEVQTSGQSIIDALTTRLGGQASTAADTFAGRMEVARARVEDVGARVGMLLIPVLEHLMTIIAGVVTWLERHRRTAEMLAVAIGTVLVVAIGVWVVATVAAMSTVAIATGGIVLAIGLLAAGVFWLATHWHQAWTDIKQWVSDGYNFIKDHFYLLMGIPVVGWMLALAMHWQDVWGGIKTVVSDAVNFITGVWNGFVSFFTGIPGTIESIASGMWNGIQDAFRAAIDFVIGLWNDFAGLSEFTLPKINLGPIHIGGEHIGPVIPTIPMLATGGLVAEAGLAYIHAGERVIPAAQVSTSGGADGAAGGDVVINTSILLDGRVVGKAVARHARKELLQTTSRNATRTGLS